MKNINLSSIKKFKTDSTVWQMLYGIAFCALSVLLAVRLFHIIDQYAVNIIFLDQVGFQTPIYEHKGLWELFTRQLGPHRQGLGEFVTWAVIHLSGWNTRAESFTILAVLYACLPVALLLKIKLTGKLQITDLWFPFLFFSPIHWEHMIITPNISHSILPLCLILFYALAWTIPNIYLRAACILTLNFLLIFTGFGIFMGLITLGLLIIELVYSIVKKNALMIRYTATCFVIALSSFAIFSIGYKFHQATDPINLSMQSLYKIPAFMALMNANLFGLKYLDHPAISLVVGFLLLFAILAIFIIHFKNYFRNPFQEKPIDKVIVALIGYSLLFSFVTALGRDSYGVNGGQVSRYMALLIPGYMGVYFALLTARINYRNVLLIAFSLMILIAGGLPMNFRDQEMMIHISRGKTLWKECYLETENYYGCNQSTGFKIHPRKESIVIERLNYFKENDLNLYLDD